MQSTRQLNQDYLRVTVPINEDNENTITPSCILRFMMFKYAHCGSGKNIANYSCNKLMIFNRLIST